jgi:hypothetical protein
MECTYFGIHPLFFVQQAHLRISPKATLGVGDAPRANSGDFHGSPSHPRADDFNQTAALLGEVAHNAKSKNTGRQQHGHFSFDSKDARIRQ